MALNIHSCFRWMRENLILLLILLGVIIGFVVGLLLNEKVQASTNPPPRELAMYIFFPGELFLRMIKLLVLPLMVSSLIIALASLDKTTAAKLGKRAAAYFLITTFIAVVVGVSLAKVLQPGVTKTYYQTKTEVKGVKTIHAVFDLIR